MSIINSLPDVKHRKERTFVVSLLRLLLKAGDVSEAFTKACLQNVQIEQKQPDVKCYLILFDKITKKKFGLV